jgi:hypothetical protein
MTDFTEAFPVLDSSDGVVACPEVSSSLSELLELAPSLDVSDGLVACVVDTLSVPEFLEIGLCSKVADVDDEISSATIPTILRGARGERAHIRDFSSTCNIPSLAELGMHDEAELS